MQCIRTSGFLLLTLVLCAVVGWPQAPSGGKVLGTVKALSGNVVSVATDVGEEVRVSVSGQARLLQLQPGQRDLKTATPVQLQDVQAGDRVLARGKMSDDGKVLEATVLVVMKQAAISQTKEQEREDWQKNGIGGLVKEVDPTARTIAVTVGAGPSGKTVTIKATDQTIVRKYAPDSIKFDDARKSALAEIKSGDQLRARGSRNPDGTEITAQEIVFGTFRNIAGTVQSVDTEAHVLTVLDLATKQASTIKITGDSQMHQLPPVMAERIAMRLKGGAPPNGTTSAEGSGNPQGSREAQGASAKGSSTTGSAPDLQRALSHLPTVSLADLKKGEAVMIVSTEGSSSIPGTAVTLLSGVEPILTASPDKGKAAMRLSPWSLDGGGGSGGEGEAQ